MSKQYIADGIDKKLKKYLIDNEKEITINNKVYFIKKFYEENIPKESITPTQQLTKEICMEKIKSFQEKYI